MHALLRTTDGYRMNHTQKLQELKEHIATLSAEEQLAINMWCSELRDILDEGRDCAFTAFALISSELTAAAQEVGDVEG
jgi:hypothetical protein